MSYTMRIIGVTYCFDNNHIWGQGSKHVWNTHSEFDRFPFSHNYIYNWFHLSTFQSNTFRIV